MDAAGRAHRHLRPPAGRVQGPRRRHRLGHRRDVARRPRKRARARR
ncbi:MAG: hypothetical protein MZV64_73200 [Ignavibacteriales bacterium]|nr:hypothetical protein [Ignavibacteriales bacterium]